MDGPIPTPDSAESDDPREPDVAPDDEARDDKDMPLEYDSDTNTILLGKGAPATLGAVAQALGRPELLRELAPGEWLLSACRPWHCGNAAPGRRSSACRQ